MENQKFIICLSCRTSDSGHWITIEAKDAEQAAAFVTLHAGELIAYVFPAEEE